LSRVSVKKHPANRASKSFDLCERQSKPPDALMQNNKFTRIVEIVGPAGAGKTTLCQALSGRNESIYPSNFPDVRAISDAPFFIWNGLQISPALLSLPKHNSRRLTRREFAWLSILHGWPDVLQKELKDHKIIILDQGPVYLMTETCEFGPEYLREQKAENLRRDLYARWAGTLDTIVWLDAPDTDLLKRIRNRDKGHAVKNESVETTFEFLARFRKAYERIISNLTTHHRNLKVLRFDTSQRSPEEIVNQLLLEFGSDL
jgi:thymidylate kinase